MPNLPHNLSKEAGEALYYALIEAVRVEIEQRAPAQFCFCYQQSNPSEQSVVGLVVEKKGVVGHCFIFPEFDHEVTERWQLIIKDTLRSYHAVFYKAKLQQENRNDFTYFHDNFLEGVQSPDVGEIAEKVLVWAFPPPRQPVPPISISEKLRLETIAHGRCLRFTPADRRRCHELRQQGHLYDASLAVGLMPDFDLTQPNMQLLPESRAILDADLRHLSPDQVVWHFPSQDDGRWPLNQTVILNTYDSAQSISRFRKLCLIVESPTRRRDAQMLHLRLAPLIPENHANRWEAARWLWDERAMAATEAERWGIADLPIDLLRQDRVVALEQLRQLCQTNQGTPGERAALAILLQDEGRFDEAMKLFNIELGPNLWKVIGNEKVYFHYCHYPQTATWVNAVRLAMRRCAPWHLLPSLHTAIERVEPWASANRGRRTRIPTFRLSMLRGQKDARKVSLLLSATDRKIAHAEFELGQTGSNRKLAEICWQRPLEIDLLRYGITDGLLSSCR